MVNAPGLSVRGVALTSVLGQARRKSEKIGPLLASEASEDLRDVLGSADPKGWYPALVHIELLDLVFRHLYDSDDDSFEEMVTASVHDDLRGLHKVLLKVRSPAWALQQAPRSFRAYFSYGEMELCEPTAVSGTLQISMEPSSHALWLGISGGARAFLEASGANAIELEREVDLAKNRCSLHLRWT